MDGLPWETFMQNYLSPLQLVDSLEVAPEAEVEFASIREFDRYRRLLWSINAQQKSKRGKRVRTEYRSRWVRGKMVHVLAVIRVR